MAQMKAAQMKAPRARRRNARGFYPPHRSRRRSATYWPPALGIASRCAQLMIEHRAPPAISVIFRASVVALRG
ncbi:MAG: hypothetical protein MUC68_04575 [Burkholderiaceae bacterium]|nr:hypothetical protein [Burkholderiaceae bacterium]